METKSFRVAGLSSCWHTQETREIFERCANGSITEFVTVAIVNYAEEMGYNCEKDIVINVGRMAQIQSMIDKSRKKDYTYLVAFEYLRWKRPGVNTSNLYRDAIVFNSC